MQNQPNVHFALVVTINDNNWAYAEPNGRAQTEFTLPLDLVSLPLVVKRLEQVYKDAQTNFYGKLAELAQEAKEAEQEVEIG